MYKYTKIFSLLTIPLAGITVFLAGGGHGTYLPFLVLFPFGLLGTVFQTSISELFFIIGILQFPVYGFLIDKFKNRKSIFLILLVHILVMTIIFIFKREEFL